MQEMRTTDSILEGPIPKGEDMNAARTIARMCENDVEAEHSRFQVGCDEEDPPKGSFLAWSIFLTVTTPVDSCGGRQREENGDVKTNPNKS